MPPKKESVTPFALRQILHNHDIRFEGPAPPRYWPDEYRHHFQAIQTIGRTVYDEYKNNAQIPRNQKNRFKKFANKLRRRSSTLLEEVNSNEDTWRELESQVLQRFNEHVICSNCYNEVYECSSEANCYFAENEAKLKDKRRQRKACTGEHYNLGRGRLDRFGERGHLFHYVNETVVTHAPGDCLDHLAISMSPDRVIGLQPPPAMPNNTDYFPLKETRLLLPFLVLEAKKATAAPGFRALQCQSAFPIRRFLKIQKELSNQDHRSEPPLVWFFGFQGEQWRLHACICDDEKVKIYDLWSGSIESQDGALQALLIVDYIWSWARDIYRPTMLQLLQESMGNARGLSPASTDRFRSSVSLEPSSQEHDDLPLGTQSGSANNHTNFHQAEHEHSQREEPSSDIILEGICAHDFLHRARAHPACSPWASIGSIRRSDSARFEIQLYMLSSPLNHVIQTVDVSVSPGINALLKSAATVAVGQLSDLLADWDGRTGFGTSPQNTGCLQVSFVFQTNCSPDDWQLRKYLKIIAWPTPTPATLDWVNLRPKLKQAISHIREFRGRDLVWAALRDISMILTPTNDGRDMQWLDFDHTQSRDDLAALFQTTRSLPLQLHVGNGCHLNIEFSMRGKTFLMKSGPYEFPRSGFPDFQRDTRDGPAMLAIRRTSWPTSCPRFCLYVMPSTEEISPQRWHILLEEAYKSRALYGQFDQQWTRSDKDALVQLVRGVRAYTSRATVSH